MKIRLTKQFRFEMAHALLGYDGLCKNIHGHSYMLFVTVMGKPVSDLSSPKLGMVMDFGDLKKIVHECIIADFDHSLVLNEKALFQNCKMETKLIKVPYQPTCENLLSDFAVRIRSRLSANVELFSLKLHETADSFAEWFASDNN